MCKEIVRFSEKQVLSDSPLQRELVQKGLQRAKEFSWEKIARETLRVYEEVLNLPLKRVLDRLQYF